MLLLSLLIACGGESNVDETTTESVGIKEDELALILIGSFKKAIKSIPDAPSVLYAGDFTDLCNFLTCTFTIN